MINYEEYKEKIEKIGTIVHPCYGKVPFKLNRAQRKTLNQIAKYRVTSVIKARQLGITSLLSVLPVIYCSVNSNTQCCFLSNKMDTSRSVIDDLRKYEDVLGFKVSSNKIVFGNGSQINFISNPNATRGMMINLLIIDEAAYCNNWLRVILPTIYDHLIVCSTANPNANDFNTFIKSYPTLKLDYTNRFEFDDNGKLPEECRKFAKEMKKIISKNHFSIEYLCKLPKATNKDKNLLFV